MGAIDLGLAAAIERAPAGGLLVDRPADGDAETEVYVRADFRTPGEGATPVISVEAEVDQLPTLTALLEGAGYKFLYIARYLD